LAFQNGTTKFSDDASSVYAEAAAAQAP
jgi:hypothetical protein